ncbi:hypothetical protein PE066_17520 [Ramlibacter tataouinensis]|uniref:hypothetical protein n=1 Tax=Ramlibacter tataouinensis TaxID=94132 RepID=UPI0022F3E924|nr:hypothetical protein [Ramlibacter tataouinensis]WBY01241.1 hypothetical protein PE066_17520 [Ramlibacter tataouinensis]
MSQFLAAAMVPVLACIALLMTMVCRLYRVGPPGSLFFVMAAAIAPAGAADGRPADHGRPAALHSPRFRLRASGWMRRLMPPLVRR